MSVATSLCSTSVRHPGSAEHSVVMSFKGGAQSFQASTRSSSPPLTAPLPQPLKPTHRKVGAIITQLCKQRTELTSASHSARMPAIQPAWPQQILCVLHGLQVPSSSASDFSSSKLSLRGQQDTGRAQTQEYCASLQHKVLAAALVHRVTMDRQWSMLPWSTVPVPANTGVNMSPRMPSVLSACHHSAASLSVGLRKQVTEPSGQCASHYQCCVPARTCWQQVQ